MIRSVMLVLLFAITTAFQFTSVRNGDNSNSEFPATAASLVNTASSQALAITSRPLGFINGFFSDELVFEDSIQSLYRSINLEEYNLSYKVFKYAMTGYFNLSQQGKLSDKKMISIIDFSKKSTLKRFYTIDLEALAVKFFTYVSHGKNTGEDEAKSFSNVVHSNQSSLGFYVTGETYVGSKGYSLKLDGMEKGYNDRIRERAVVIHNAEYVSEAWIKKYGRLGRSQGCPALPVELGKKIIDVVKEKTMVFAYFDDEQYLRSSSILDASSLIQTLTASAKVQD
ncbi:murein L,D-transpeptidase catalytic domain family protein [Chryseolinea sp. T2]|uniref:murein L,D-transpeptidase catalytic domain family protein n=1 Tax=Chryseolinea sp. T2 TaxID=3129255 RepID=UPI003077DA16